MWRDVQTSFLGFWNVFSQGLLKVEDDDEFRAIANIWRHPLSSFQFVLFWHSAVYKFMHLRIRLHKALFINFPPFQHIPIVVI